MNRLVVIVGMSMLLAGCGSDSAPDPSATRPDAGMPAAGSEPAPAPAPEAPIPTATDVPIIAQAFAYGATEQRNFVGYFVAPSEISEPLPGVVLVHERWGLDDSIRRLASNLAMEGYAVLAVDLFDTAVATDAATAQDLVGAALADRAGSLGNIGQAIDYLRAYALAPRVALLGYGMGGGLSLEAALAMPGKVDAVVTYYGQPVYDEGELERLRAPLLGFFAEQDESISVRNVRAFRGTLQAMDKDAQVLIQIGVGHGFADPSRPTYAPDVAARSWADVLTFLERTLEVP